MKIAAVVLLVQCTLVTCQPIQDAIAVYGAIEANEPSTNEYYVEDYQEISYSIDDGNNALMSSIYDDNGNDGDDDNEIDFLLRSSSVNNRSRGLKGSDDDFDEDEDIQVDVDGDVDSKELPYADDSKESWPLFDPVDYSSGISCKLTLFDGNLEPFM